MPVTAKLSKRFYDTFGDEIANELVDWFNQVDATYRADLREFNELNFQRFDAKLEQRLSAFRTELVDQLRDEFRTGLAAVRDELRTDLTAVRDELGTRMTSAESAIAMLKAETEKGMASLRVAVAEQRTETAKQLSKLRTELLRWMVGLWMATIGTLAGLMLGLYQLAS